MGSIMANRPTRVVQKKFCQAAQSIEEKILRPGTLCVIALDVGHRSQHLCHMLILLQHLHRDALMVLTMIDF